MSDAGTMEARANTGSAEVRPWRAPEVGGPSKAPLTAERLAAIEQQAYSEGYQRGFDEGRRDGREEMRRQAADLEQLLGAIHPQVSVLDDDLTDQLGDLVIAIARQFVRRELRQAPGEVVRVVRDALGVLPISDAVIRIYLHPEDTELVRRVISPDTLERQVRILEDVTLTRG